MEQGLRTKYDLEGGDFEVSRALTLSNEGQEAIFAGFFLFFQ